MATFADEDQGTESSSNQLLQSAKAGDKNALKKLLLQHKNYLLAVAKRRFKDALSDGFGGPEDLVQETLGKAWKCFGRFHGDDVRVFRGWLRAILLYSGNKHLAKRAKMALNSQVPDSAPTPSSLAHRQEVAAIQDAAIDGLSTNQRQVVLMRREGHRFRIIARTMDLSIPRVHQIYSEALIRLGENPMVRNLREAEQ